MSDDIIEGKVVDLDKLATNKPKKDTLEYFEQEISLQWYRAVESIIKVGSLLSDARRVLGNKEMNKLCTSLGMGIRTRQRLIQIANYEPFRDASILTQLPSSYSTLAKIAHLPKDVFEKALEEKIITPESTGSSITSHIKKLNFSQVVEVQKPRANYEFMKVYIDLNQTDGTQLDELAELKRRIDSIPNVRSEVTDKAKKYLEKMDNDVVLRKVNRTLSLARDGLVERAEEKANKEGKTFFAITGFEKATLYDFHPIAAVKALGGDLRLFDVEPVVFDMNPYEINDFMGNKHR